MTIITEEQQQLIKAVRNDPKIGEGTCTTVDECLDDSDLVRDFIKPGMTEKQLLTELYEYEGIWIERCVEANRLGGENEGLCEELEEKLADLRG